MGNQLPSPKRGGGRALNFRPIFIVSKWLDASRCTWYGGRPQRRRLCVRWEPSFSSPKGAQPHTIFGQCPLWPNDWWTKMALDMEVGLGPGDFVFDGDAAVPRKKAHPPPPSFWPMWPSGWMDEDATWYGSRPRPRPHCIRRGPSSALKGHSSPLFSAHVYCGHGRPSQLLLGSFPTSWQSQNCQNRDLHIHRPN